ncbi:MAG TPA: porin family protein [Bacteroidales bacterium]|nr:porin family protein [Bacteroidales bacterium]
MMKKLFVIILVVLIAIPSFSQIKFGLKAGVTSSTVPTYDLSSGSSNIEALKDAAIGFHAGAFMRLTLFGIYIMPEVVFASTTYDYDVTIGSNPSEALSQKFNKLEIPVLVGFKLGPLRINAGPAASVMIGSPKALIDDPGFDDMYNKATFGYQAGVGFDLFNKLTFDVRYGGAFGEKFGDVISIGSQTFALDDRKPTFMLSLGLMF